METWVGVWLVVAVVCCGVAEWAGTQRGHVGCSKFGFFLGPLGVVIALLLPPTVEWEAQRRAEVAELVRFRRWRENKKTDAAP